MEVMKVSEECLKQHQLFRQMLEREILDLHKYLEESLQVLKKNEIGWMQKYKEMDLAPSDRKNDIDTEPAASLYFRSTPFLLKHSLFISVYSFLEFSLKKYCEVVTCGFLKYRRRVINYEKVHQFYSFLTDDLKLDKQRVEEDWQKLNIFRDIRNSIVHHNSTIGKNISAKTYEYIKEDPRIIFEEPKGFRISDDDLILELLHVSEKFLFTLMDEFNATYQRSI